MSIELKSDRLRVIIAEPGVAPNTTTRFDRAGFITQVTLDDKYDFCTAEPDNLSHPCTGGIGLCNEIRCIEGYEEARPGEMFPKFGVGLMVKLDDSRYMYFRKYECRPFKVEYETGDNYATFYTYPEECNGYALFHEKKISVERNKLIMSLRIENRGQKPVVLNEYCHNFVTIEKLPLSSGYRIDMPTISSQNGKQPKLAGTIYGEGTGFTFSGYCDTAALIEVMSDEIDKVKAFHWEISNKFSDVSLSETTSFIPSKVVVWCIDHIISPEVINSVLIEPGKYAEWTREWTFWRSAAGK